MITKEDFRERLKRYGLETAQNIKVEQADTLWDRVKYHDQAVVWQALEAMTYDECKATVKNIKDAIRSKLTKSRPQENQINPETWPDIQKQRMKALTEAIQRGPQALQTLKAEQVAGKGIWDFENDQIGSKYDCHENCDHGTVFYQDKEGHSYAGTCAICKRGPGKPSPLINPDNLQVIKWGDQRQGG